MVALMWKDAAGGGVEQQGAAEDVDRSLSNVNSGARIYDATGTMVADEKETMAHDSLS